MIKSIPVIALSLLIAGCAREPERTAANTEPERPMRTERMRATTAHTTENEQPPAASNSAAPGSKWSQSGDPIDTAGLDGAIAAAEKDLKVRAGDDAAKKALADAYYRRGFALTEARQYASALGDYRRALKYDPGHEDAQKWIDQIVLIYTSMKKEYPKEGEEPPPLPFKK
jgi:tetratricopeptide (TPR) repeat protein